MLAFGGCGGLFAGDIAHEVGARRAVVPELAPVFSAYGAATAVLRRERSRSVAQRLPGEPAVLLGTLDQLRRSVLDDLADDGVDAASAQVRLEADVRFERQGSELTVTIETGPDGAPDLSTLAPRFVADYVARFGEGAVAMGVGVEVMTLRAVGSAPPRSDDERLTAVTAEGTGGGPAVPIGTRPVRLAARRRRRGRPCTAASTWRPARRWWARRSSTPATPRSGWRRATAPPSTSTAR